MSWKQRWHTLGWVAAAVAVALAGLTFGYSLEARRLARQPRPEPLALEPAQPADGQDSGPVVIDEATQVVRRTTYLKCGETIEESGPADPELVGLSLEAFRRFHPDWTVLAFGRERVEVRVIKDEWCPSLDPAEMERYRTIGVHDGKVTVFWGKPGPHRPIKEVTTFGADRLPPQERQLLEKGYVVEGDEGVAQYLEGLAE